MTNEQTANSVAAFSEAEYIAVKGKTLDVVASMIHANARCVVLTETGDRVTARWEYPTYSATFTFAPGVDPITRQIGIRFNKLFSVY